MKLFVDLPGGHATLSRLTTIGKFNVYFNNASYTDYIISKKEFFIYQNSFFVTNLFNFFNQSFTNEFILSLGASMDSVEYGFRFSLWYYDFLRYYINFFRFSSLNPGNIYLGKFRIIQNFGRSKSVNLTFKFNVKQPQYLLSYMPYTTALFKAAYSLTLTNFIEFSHDIFLNRNFSFLKFIIYNILLFRFNIIYNKIYFGRLSFMKRFLNIKYSYALLKLLIKVNMCKPKTLKVLNEQLLYSGLTYRAKEPFEKKWVRHRHNFKLFKLMNRVDENVKLISLLYMNFNKKKFLRFLKFRKKINGYVPAFENNIFNYNKILRKLIKSYKHSKKNRRWFTKRSEKKYITPSVKIKKFRKNAREYILLNKYKIKKLMPKYHNYVFNFN
jgi:hypothetical protein